ncbi:MAG: deoxyguanosinetriphosphate triphosphohydrolase, partial [Mesorhizobium sp.]
IERLKPDSADAVRAAGETMVTFSADMAAAEKELKAFLYKHLYRHSEVMRVRTDAEQIVRDLFDAYFAD